jgi:hypothetical protein
MNGNRLEFLQNHQSRIAARWKTVELTIDDWQRAHMLELNIDLKTAKAN